MILSSLVRSSLSVLKLPSQNINMKAFILLCLLHFAFGQNPYMWPGYDNQKPSSECREDLGSCGCCTMLLEIERLRNHTTWSLNELENEYQKIYQTFSNLKKSRTAFSGAIAEDGFKECIGPFGDQEIIKYNHVFINKNNGYNDTTGIFTVPYSGVYSIAFTVYTDSGAPGSAFAACAVLEVNQQPIARTTDINRNDQEDQSGHVVALELQKGDSVAVNLPAGCYLCDESSRYNTFSVFLLYATE